MQNIRIISVLLITMLAACHPNVSPDSYSLGSVGQVNRAVRGTVISTRLVDISGTSGVGATAGALGGAVGGSAIGSGARSNIAGAIGGAIVGGVAGAVIEEGATQQKGMEYTVETENGALLTIVQGVDTPLSVGQKVIVLYGSKSRVIADTSHK